MLWHRKHWRMMASIETWIALDGHAVHFCFSQLGIPTGGSFVTSLEKSLFSEKCSPPMHLAVDKSVFPIRFKREASRTRSSTCSSSSPPCNIETQGRTQDIRTSNNCEIDFLVQGLTKKMDCLDVLRSSENTLHVHIDKVEASSRFVAGPPLDASNLSWSTPDRHVSAWVSSSSTLAEAVVRQRNTCTCNSNFHRGFGTRLLRLANPVHVTWKWKQNRDPRNNAM